MPESILHLSIPSLSSYRATHTLQTHLVQHLLDLNAAAKPLPPPLILTMELLRTFTFGRRQRIKQEDKSALSEFGAVVHALRGGLATYHGPGQVVGYPLLDFKTHRLVASKSLKNTDIDAEKIRMETRILDNQYLSKIRCRGVQNGRHGSVDESALWRGGNSKNWINWDSFTTGNNIARDWIECYERSA